MEGEGVQVTATQTPDDQEGGGWRDVYLKDTDLYTEPTLATIKDVPALARLALEARKTVGRYGTEKGILPPKEGAPPEEVAAFYTALGRPEKPEGYEIAAPKDMPEGFPYSPELEGQFKQWAFEEGLTAAQAKNLFQKYLTANVEVFSSHNEAQAAAFKKDQEAISAALKQEWGDKYEENITIAQTAMHEFFPPGSKALAALDLAIGDDPDLIRMAYTIGRRMGEAGFVKGGRSAVSSLETRKQELSAHTAFLDNNHAEHNRVVKEFNEVVEQIVKEEEAREQKQG